MADNDDIKDEYHFSELDPLDPHVMDEDSASTSSDSVSIDRAKIGGNKVRRNAMIAIAAFISVVVIYKFTGAALNEKKLDIVKAPSTLTPPPSAQPEVASTPSPETVLPVIRESVSLSNNDVQSKLSNVESSQESIRQDLSAFNGQVSGMTNNITALTEKLNGLTSTINALNEKLESQSLEIKKLSANHSVQHVKSYRVKAESHLLKYYIQAVIPGRAWLVATNGNTLTVREGSTIPGYGIVKLIDPSQGRILTSSGQMIRFSQDDS